MASAHTFTASSAVPLAWSVKGQICALRHEARLPVKIAGSLLLWPIVILHIIYTGVLHFLMCPHHFIVESPLHFGEALILTEKDAELSCSHLCPSGLGFGEAPRLSGSGCTVRGACAGRL